MRRLCSISWRYCLLSLTTIIILYTYVRPAPTSDLFQQIAKTQIQHGSTLHLDFEQSSGEETRDQDKTIGNKYIASVAACHVHPNPHIHHLRLSYSHLGISFVPPGSPPQPDLRLFNPTLLSLPAWETSATYLVVSRVVTEGLHQESLICLADFCVPANATTRHGGGLRTCIEEDIATLGNHGGLRCKKPPIRLSIPPTPALQCEGPWSSFPDIPGFHDPRIFWSGKGEPLIILNSASQYGCVGLWVSDLRTLFPELEKIVNRHGKHGGPVMSYPHLTEITRNPRSSRASVEKNWMLWFPGEDGEAYVQYDLGPTSMSLNPQPPSLNRTTLYETIRGQKASGRALARLIGNGFTTPNLTSIHEASCFGESDNYDSRGKLGHWHQGSNSLKLILCTRLQARAGECGQSDEWNENGREVHFANMHRKFSNDLDLPMRYERYVAVWEGRPPFSMLGVSKFPILMRDEWARPWSESENWPSEEVPTSNWTYSHIKRTKDSMVKSSAYFTYTPSLAWAWRSRMEHTVEPGARHDESEDEKDVHHLSQLGTGYLGDEVIVGVGLDDLGQAAVRVKVDELVGCLRLCPGVNV